MVERIRAGGSGAIGLSYRDKGLRSPWYDMGRWRVKGLGAISGLSRGIL